MKGMPISTKGGGVRQGKAPKRTHSSRDPNAKGRPRLVYVPAVLDDPMDIAAREAVARAMTRNGAKT